MKLGLALLGALLGLLIAPHRGYLFGAATGLAIGFMVAQLRELSTRLKKLEAKKGSAVAPVPSPAVTPAAAPTRSAHTVPEPQATSAKATTESGSPQSPTESAAPKPIPRQPLPLGAPSRVDQFFQMMKNWFTTGNVPVKVGVVVSFFGVAFLLKYSVDRQLLVLPIELRLLAVSAFAIVLLAIGWRLHKKAPVYGLSLQGGGIGMLYLNIFAAFRLYSLLPPLFAFGLLVLLTVSAGALALLQNAKALAVLGIVGGFMAPVLISTGSGNHVVLFSYYLVLNLAIVGIARFHAWRTLNVLGFLFTFIIGTQWGYQYYKPERHDEPLC